MIARVDDDRVVGNAQLFELSDQLADDPVDARHGLVVADQVLRLEVRVIVVVVPLPACLVIDDAFRDKPIRIQAGILRGLDVLVPIEPVKDGMPGEPRVGVGRIGHDLARVVVAVRVRPLRIHRRHDGIVWRRETYGEIERRVIRARVEKLLDVLAHDLGRDVVLGVLVNVRRRIVRHVLGPEREPAVVGTPVVELRRGTAVERIELHAELADEARVVTRLPQQGGIGLLPLWLGNLVRRVESQAAHALVLPGEESKAARRADGLNRERIRKTHAVARELIDMWRLRERMPGGRQGVSALVVGE